MPNADDGDLGAIGALVVCVVALMRLQNRDVLNTRLAEEEAHYRARLEFPSPEIEAFDSVMEEVRARLSQP